MREDIEDLLNEKMNEIEIDSSSNEELIKQIEEKINNQNISVEEERKRKEIIKSFLKNNNITSMNQLSDEQIKNILNYKV